jgi:C4-dicarboxylate-specific signal transduction histidine kinase
MVITKRLIPRLDPSACSQLPLTVEAEQNLGAVTTDPMRLRQILLNPLRNAYQSKNRQGARPRSPTDASCPGLIE